MPLSFHIRRIIGVIFLLVLLIFFGDMSDAVSLLDLHEKIDWEIFLLLWALFALLIIRPSVEEAREFQELKKRRRIEKKNPNI